MKIRSISYRTAALLVLSVIVIVSLFVNSTISYFVVKKTARNVFRVGLVELTITEENYPEDENDRRTVPQSIVPKDPRIVNTGSVDAYAFLEVTVPYEEVQMIIEEGENINLPDPRGITDSELFDLISDDPGALSAVSAEGFTATDTGRFTYSHEWVFLESSEDSENKTHTYLFGYSSLLTTEDGGKTTSSIFDKVRLRNILEGSIPDNEIRTIRLSAFGIQSEELKGIVEIADNNDLTAAELQSIYSYYKNQEG